VAAYSFAVAWVIGTVIEKTMGFRVRPDAEIEGVDLHEHAEAGYDFSSIVPSSNGKAAELSAVPKEPAAAGVPVP
jgi:Amt family ammonium transporter